MDDGTGPRTRTDAGDGLAGQVALVSGGGRGIGRAIAESLAAAGAAVAVTARSADQLAETAGRIEAAGGRVLALPADVADRTAVDRLTEDVERRLGPLDLLVNNAGVLTPIGVVWEVDPEEWWRCLEINLRGPFLCTRAVLPGMFARRRGRIVNLSSGAAHGPCPDGSAYASSKAALERFTDTLAAETAGAGVSVFAVTPGNVPTAMHEYLSRSEAWLKRRGRHAPVYTPAERTAELVLALARGQADALSGRVISVHDDLEDLVRRAEEIRRDDSYALRLRK